jgi:YesN/AraC family two-component response regulator
MLKAYEFFKIVKYQSIGEVMYAVGILSRPYFTKVFKKRFGMNPGEMLRDNSKKVKY